MSKIFGGAIPTSTTVYIPVQIKGGAIGVHIGWKDAVSSATITLELSSVDGVSFTSAGSAWEWKDSGLTITGPAASAASSTLVNVENVRQYSARLKIVTAAVSTFEIWDGLA